jgi:AAA domain
VSHALYLTILHTVTVTRAKVSVPADVLTHELQFPDLLHTPIFRTFLQPPGLHSSSTAEHPVLRSQPVLKGLKPHVGEDILAFPTAPKAAREEGVRRTVAEFGLNADQEAVLTLVSSWFTPRDEMCHEESTDIILVEGVFGSGKSHLLASVCVLIKRLSIISAATMSSLDSQHQPGNLLGVKRSLSGGGVAHPARPCSAVKCLLSANTNVAVDRVMVQLANRTVSITTTSSADDALADDGDDASIWDNRIEEKQEHTASSPVIARVGCVAKIDRSLRKHFVLQAESKANALRELVRLSKTDSDPQLLKMADDTRKTDFSFIQTKMIQDADVIGVTCASAANVLLKGIRCHVLILDEASQMTEPLSLLPLACVRPLRLLLVGDSKQLPPALATSATSMQEAISNSTSNPSNVSTALSANSPDRGNEMDTIRVKKSISTTLTRTLFDRLQETGWPCITLRTQYRCHPAIAQICR